MLGVFLVFFFFFWVLGKVVMATPLPVETKRQWNGEEGGLEKGGKVEKGFNFLFKIFFFKMTKTKMIYNCRN